MKADVESKLDVLSVCFILESLISLL